MSIKLPDKPGVYFFLGPPKRSGGGLNKKKQILYIGKATSLRNRVRSYFAGNIGEKRGPLIEKMMSEKKLGIKFIETDSVLEALLLEAELIRKHLPQYNTIGKDQKSFNFVVITKEEFPRVLVVRGSELTSPKCSLALSQGKGQNAENPPLGGGAGTPAGGDFGPFPSGSELREALKIIRRIFPFRDKCEPGTKACFNYQIGLCPGMCAGKISSKEYKKTIKNITLFFQGKKKKLVKGLEKEMREAAKERQFERAEKIKRQVFALNHINDIAMIRSSKSEIRNPKLRIEAYDISHISGTNIVGVFTVVEGGEMKKSDYRMFKIRTWLGRPAGGDDTKALGEVLERRLRHTEWPMPDLIVVDGGVAQMNVAKLKIENSKLKIPVVSVVKDKHHKPREILGNKTLVKKHERAILLANAESHRFALAFHRHLRSKL